MGWLIFDEVIGPTVVCDEWEVRGVLRLRVHLEAIPGLRPFEEIASSPAESGHAMHTAPSHQNRNSGSDDQVGAGG